MMIVASVRTSPSTPKTIGMTIASAVLDDRKMPPSGTILGPWPWQETNVDDEFTDIPISFGLWQ